MGKSGEVAPAGLFDRLCRDARPIESPEDYYEVVVADLQDLLGTVRRWSDAELADHREIERSILNYGVPPITGRVISRDSADELAREIREAILRFDPRFDPGSLNVTATVDPDRTPLDALTLQLEGHLQGFPQPVPFFARVKADLESGLLELIPEVAAP